MVLCFSSSEPTINTKEYENQIHEDSLTKIEPLEPDDKKNRDCMAEN